MMSTVKSLYRLINAKVPGEEAFNLLDMASLIQMVKFQPKDGTITFRGNRMLLFNANALCLLREELIHTLGLEIARGV